MNSNKENSLLGYEVSAEAKTNNKESEQVIKDIKFVKDHLNLDTIAGEYLNLEGYELRGLLGNCEDDGFPGEFDIDDLVKLNQAFDDIIAVLYSCKREMKIAVENLFDEEEKRNLK